MSGAVGFEPTLSPWSARATITLRPQTLYLFQSLNINHNTIPPQNKTANIITAPLYIWWARRDSNSHAKKQQYLKLSCIPISPLALKLVGTE